MTRTERPHGGRTLTTHADTTPHAPKNPTAPEQLTTPELVQGADFVVGWNPDHGDFILAGEEAYLRHHGLTSAWPPHPPPRGVRLPASPVDGSLDAAIEAVRVWSELRTQLDRSR